VEQQLHKFPACTAIRHKPPKVVTILAGGIFKDFSPCSSITIDGQHASTQTAELEAPASILMADPHPGAAASVKLLSSVPDVVDATL